MSARYLVDSVILIDLLNGIHQAQAWLSALKPGEAVLSPITIAEVMTGLSDNDLVAGEELLDLYDVLVVDKKIAVMAARLRAQERWKLPDAFQAALAQANGLKLVTRNSKDFPPSVYSFVLVPYQIH